MNKAVPPYTGIAFLILGMIVFALKTFNIVDIPPPDVETLKGAISAIIGAIILIIPIWRLYFTKKIADVAVAQVKAAGIAPVVGPDKGIVPSIDEQAKAAQVVNKEILK